MTIKRFAFFILLFMVGIVNAQNDFRPGFIIDIKGDTSVGLIDYRGDILMDRVCKFIPRGSTQEFIYSPHDIQAYRFFDSKFYVSKEINGQKIFLEFLIKGMINIYFSRDEINSHYYIEKEGLGITELAYEEGEKYHDNAYYDYKSTKHIGILNYYLKDEPSFQAEISTLKTPNHTNLIKLAVDYHHLICKDNACIIYEKKVPFITLNLEANLGFAMVQDIVFYFHKSSYFQPGLLVNICITDVSEKLYFRTGMIGFTMDSDPTDQLSYKIPLQFEYIFPKGIFRPKFAYGINLYHPFYQSVSCMAGINIQFDTSMFFSLNYDFDFKPMESFWLFPNTLISNAFSIGLGINL